jgi:pSer/pThr/pTyr-binding forkhead associated (FHA) protein
VDGLVEARGRDADPAPVLPGSTVNEPANQTVANVTQLAVFQQSQAVTTTVASNSPAATIGRQKTGAPVCGASSSAR